MDSTIHTNIPYFISSNTTAVVMSSEQYFITTYNLALCIIINSKIFLNFYYDIYIHVVKYNSRLNKYIKSISSVVYYYKI